MKLSRIENAEKYKKIGKIGVVVKIFQKSFFVSFGTTMWLNFISKLIFTKQMRFGHILRDYKISK